jgi:hypothetical protein
MKDRPNLGLSFSQRPAHSLGKIEISSSFAKCIHSSHPMALLENSCNKQGSHKNLIFYIKDKQGKCISISGLGPGKNTPESFYSKLLKTIP